MLSDLVGFLRCLEQFDIECCQSAIRNELDKIIPNLKSSTLLSKDIKKLVGDKHQRIQDSVAEFGDSITAVKQQIASKIIEIESGYYHNSLDLFNTGVRLHESAEQILDRRLSLDNGIVEILTNRIGVRSDWQYPGMIIRPARESWIDLLVGLDPLYLVDDRDELFDPIRERFNKQYLSRLRMCVIDRMRDDNILEILPDNQFAFCLAYNFFNYRPLENFHQYLKELYVKLRSGGRLALTINDCDKAGAVMLAENNAACYTPGHAVKSLAQNLGFDVVYELSLSSATTWLELEKPGKLYTIRGGQTLAKIIAKQ